MYKYQPPFLLLCLLLTCGIRLRDLSEDKTSYAENAECAVDQEREYGPCAGLDYDPTKHDGHLADDNHDFLCVANFHHNNPAEINF